MLCPSFYEVKEDKFPIMLNLVLATTQNFTGKIFYNRPACFLHKDAAVCLGKAAAYAKSMGYTLKIYDAFRPVEVQGQLWRHVSDPRFVMPPAIGSCHSRGIAVDVTLVKEDLTECDMGTEVDAFTLRSSHGMTLLPAEAQRHRMILLGIMTAAGWELNRYEWWHYQLPNALSYPLLTDVEAGTNLLLKESS